MEINVGNINALTTKVVTAFNKRIGTAPSLYKAFTQIVPSSSGENFYPRMAEIPGLREWVGDRIIHRLKANAFSIRNKTFEGTLAILREDMEDDNYGFLADTVQELAAEAGDLADQLVFGELEKGVSTECMDGQYYFDPDHVTWDETGKNKVPYANISTPQDGEQAVAPWYLFCTTRALKPMIFQTRRAFTVTAKTQLQADNVFFGREFIWGVDGRCNAGLGMYQFAFRSTRPLTGDALGDAIAQMSKQRRRDGTPYGIRPDLLVVPSNLEGAGRSLINGETVPGKAPDGKTYLPVTNQWKGVVKLMVAPRLSTSVGA